ncbi:efflux RND transporter periplasmic adaptor subunit [Elusimicrobiota bacterium]
MDKKKKIIAAVVLVLILGALIFNYLRNMNFMYAGTIEATEVDISSRLMSVISNFDIEEGKEVKKDDILVKLDIEDVNVAYKAAESDFNRAKKLLKAGSMNREMYDRVKYKIDDLKIRKNWGSIKAPLSGTVISKYREAGEMVNPGTKLLTIADLDTVWAYVYVPQPMLSEISLNMELEGIIPGEKRKFMGRISRIKDEAEFTPRNVQTRKERTRLVYGVKIEFKNSDRFLKPGMTIEVKLP